MSFVIIKSGLTHWTATLKFLQHFLFNDLTDISEKGADSFLVSTLEASMTHIENIAEIQREKDLKIPTHFEMKCKFQSKNEFMDYAFEQVRCGNEREILRLFRTDKNVEIFKEIITTDTNGTCHPLCDCPKCDQVITDTQINVNMQNVHGINMFHVAAMYGLPKMINLLLALDADLTIVDENNWTALHYAAARGHQSALLLLLHAGMNINDQTSEQFTALHLSCLNGHLGCVKALLYYSDHMRVKVDKNQTTKMGDTALHLAAKWGFTEIIDTLLEYGVRVDSPNRWGHTASDYAHSSFVEEQLQNVFILIDNGDESQNQLDGITGPAVSRPEPFRGCISEEVLCEQLQKKTNTDKVIAAIKNGDTKLAYHFLGIEDPTRRTKEPCHPLCQCIHCKLKIDTTSQTKVQNIIDIDLNKTNANGYTMLHVAAQMANIEFVQFLLNNGAMVNCRTVTQQTPLHLAVLSKCIQTTDLILTYISENALNAQDIDGNTALHLAVQSGRTEMVETILRHEPILNILNNGQHTAMDIAKASFHFNIIRQLELAGSETSFMQ